MNEKMKKESASVLSFSKKPRFCPCEKVVTLSNLKYCNFCIYNARMSNINVEDYVKSLVEYSKIKENQCVYCQGLNTIKDKSENEYVCKPGYGCSKKKKSK